jgi:predicted  nucleic acid-binding Zn-ribbon protein
MRYMALQAGVAGAGQMYVCTDAEGKKTFQAMPCAGAAKAEVRAYDVALSGDSYRPTTDSAVYQQMKADNRKAQLKRDIRKSEQQIEKYQAQMQSELAALRSKKRYATNTQAGATWEQSISTEMQAVTSRYDSLMDVERDNLKMMRQELIGL